MKTTLLLILLALAAGCSTPRKPNPFDVTPSEWNFDSATGKWTH